jgi:hypothetical protein
LVKSTTLNSHFLKIDSKVISTNTVLVIEIVLVLVLSQDSSVGIVTRYGPDGLGIESRWDQNFPHPSRPALGPTQPPIPHYSSTESDYT